MTHSLSLSKLQFLSSNRNNFKFIATPFRPPSSSSSSAYSRPSLSLSTASRIPSLLLLPLRVLRLSSISLFSLFSNKMSSTSISCSEDTAHTTPRLSLLPESGIESCCLVLCGKSTAEIEKASILKRRSSLKLTGGVDQQQVSMILCTDVATHQTFNTDLYMENLSTELFGRFLIWSPRLSSTHDLVSQNFDELPVGSVCVADVQFKGRGRSSNTWESPPGCLMFSFTLEMDNGRILPHLQYVVSLAATEAIKMACQAKGFPPLDVRIKWPNDLYLNNLKVGGVLCTSTYRSKKFNVSAGLGLNLDNEVPTTCLNTVLRQLTFGVGHLTREELLATFFSKFEALCHLFLTQGFQSLEELYYRTWLHSGQRVIVEDKTSHPFPDNTVLTIKGLTLSGYLLGVDDEKKEYELHPDGNSFDFFKGLVKKKL